ncbi:MAG: PQQ-binding-like beta-propeller repeat protein [Candidatus Aenigmatarchaeota archaeon]
MRLKFAFFLIMFFLPIVYALSWYLDLNRIGFFDGKHQFNITVIDAEKVTLQLNQTNYSASKEGNNYYVYLPKLDGKYYYNWIIEANNETINTDNFIYEYNEPKIKERMKTKGFNVTLEKSGKYKIHLEKGNKKIELNDIINFTGDEDIFIREDANYSQFAFTNKINVRDFVWVDVFGFNDYKGKIYLPSIYSSVFYCEGTYQQPDCKFIDQCGEEPCYKIENKSTVIYLLHFSGGGGGDPVLQFNQTQTVNITGNASTINQDLINSYLNINADSQTWDVSESPLQESWQSSNQLSETLQFKQVSREQKTVEYFIYQDMTQMAANTERSGTFTIYIPEKNPQIKSAYVEIKNVIYNAQIASGGTIKIWNGTDNTTLLTTNAGTAATGEQMIHIIRANATQALSYINSSGQYTLTLYTRLSPIRQGESAKLVLTYEYDSDSPRQIKTIKFFVGQLTTALAVGSSTNFQIPPLNLPEKNVQIRDSFFETYFHLQPGGTVDEGISIDLDGANAISGTPLDNAGATTFDGFFLYKNIFDTNTAHTFNFRPTAGYAIDTVGTELILTYEYDADSPRQLKTVKYLIGQDPNIYTTNNMITFSREIEIPDSISIKSIYNKIRFSIAYGSGAGTTAYTTTIYANSSLQGQSSPQIAYTLGLRDEQVSTSTILYNATSLYNLANGNTVLCTISSTAATTSYYTSARGCELTITYEYSLPSFIKTVEYFADETHKLPLSMSERLNLSFSIPEENSFLKQTYIDVKGFTGYITAANIFLNSSIITSGSVTQTCVFRNTGENRYDTCWDDVSDNITSPNSYQILVGSGTATTVTRWYNAIADFTYNYTGAKEKNSTWQTFSFSGQDFSSLDSVSAVLTISYYNPSASNSSLNNNNRPDIEVAFYNGTDYLNGYYCNLQSLSNNLPYSDQWNCIITTTDVSILNAWKTATNRQIRIRSVWMDNADYFSDQINISAIYTNITRTFYKLKVEHNTSISYQGLLLSLNASINFSSNIDDVFNMSIYNFAQQKWDSSFCQNISASSNQYYIASCNITENPQNYVSSGLVSIILETTMDEDRATMKEEYVQFYIGYQANRAPFLQYNLEFPSSPATYSPGASYIFNITINDLDGESDISTVFFEWNGLNETVTNYVIHNSTARNYSVIKTDLPSSVYSFRWYANDSYDEWSNVVQGTYIINKATPSLTIDFSDNDVDYPIETTVTCNKLSGDYSASIILLRNYTQVSQNPGSYVSETITLGAGVWNYSCIYIGSENYTDYSLLDQYLQVNKGKNVLSIQCLPMQTVVYPKQTTCTGIQNSNGDSDVTYYLYRDDVLIEQKINENPQEIILLGAGSYLYKFNSSEGSNYTSNSTGITINLVVQQNTSTLNFMNLTINSTETNKIYTYPVTTNITAWYNSNSFIGSTPTFILYKNGSEIGSTNPVTELSELSASEYNYTYYTPGNQNYSSAFKQLNLTIQKANILPYLHVSINGTELDSSYIYENVTNVTAWSSLSNDNINYYFYRNTTDSSILIGSNNIISETLLLGAKTYYYVFNTSGNENYSSGSITRVLTIEKKTPIPNIEILPSVTNIYPTETSAICSIYSINNEIIPKLYRNTSYVNPLPLSTETIILAAGVHEYVCNNTETQNYTQASVSSILTIQKSATETKLYLNGSESDNTYSLKQTANITASLNVSGKTIYLDSNISGWVLQSSYTPLFNYTYLSSIGTFNITAYFEGDENYTSSSKTLYLTVVDDEKPKYNYLLQNASWIGVGHSILLAANWSDNYDLDYAWLSTNETGIWENKSFIDINLTEGQTWSNFTWSNNSIPAGRIIGWRIYANDTSGNVNATSVMTFSINASELWRFNTAGFIYSSPAIGDINGDNNIDVVFASYDKKVYALQGSNGQILFEFLTNHSIASSPSLSPVQGSSYLYIFIPSYDKNMYAINGSDGTKTWNFSTDGLIYSSPAVFDINNDGIPEIIFGSYDKNVYVLNSTNGEKIWSYSTGDRIASSPSVIAFNGDVLIVIGSYDKKLYALNSTGDLIWQFSASDKIESSPAIGDINDDGIYEVVFGSYDNKTYVVNASNGELIWSYATGNWITSSPVIADIAGDKKVIIASHDSNVYSFNKDGTINWTFTIPTGGRIQSSPSIADVDLDGISDVIVGCSDSRLYALNGLTGKPIWSYKVNAYIFSSPALADINGDGNIDFIFGSFDKNLYSLDPPVWQIFGGNERRTRIYDDASPELIYFEINNETRQIISLWQERFSNLAFGIIKENSTGIEKEHIILLKGMKDWINFSYYSSSFYYSIEVFDEYNNSRKVEGFIEGEKDIKPPLYFGNISAVEIYSPNKIYSFLLNWTDKNNIEEILIEHNFTGITINQSVINNIFSIFDLPADTYYWRSYAKDYAGNWNKTEQFYLKVEKAKRDAFLLLVNSTYPKNITAICGGDEFYRNSTLVANIDYSILDAGTWNYTCVKKEDQNYTISIAQDFLKVQKGLPELYLNINYTGRCPAKIILNAFEKNNGDKDVVYILKNDTHEFLGSNITLSYQIFPGKYNFSYLSSEGNNWTQNSLNKQIIINDDTKPIIADHRIKRINDTVIIEINAKDKCSLVKRAIFIENSLGFYRNHTIYGENKFNFAFPSQDLKDVKTCSWFGRLCLKFVNYKIFVFDDFDNENFVQGNFVYWFFR